MLKYINDRWNKTDCFCLFHVIFIQASDLLEGMGQRGLAANAITCSALAIRHEYNMIDY